MKLFVLGAAAAMIAGSAHAQELYRQDPINSFGGLSAQDARNPGGLGWFSEVVDSFDAAADWRIGSVEFWGGYVTDIPGNTTGFTIRFYDGEAGLVGQRLYEADVSSFTETEYYSTFINGLGTVRGYHYVVQLPTPFAVPQAGAYWISVTALLARGGTANEPQWGWVQANSFHAPACQQWFFSPGNFRPQSQDVAFVLNAAAGAPPCNPDYNDDGNVDQEDIRYLVNVIAGGENPTGHDPDFNADGNIDQSDFIDLVNVVAGGDCP